jgi:hypothetical protein
MAWLYLPHEIMKVANQRLADDTVSGIGRMAYSFQHRFGYGRLIEVSHHGLLFFSLNMKPR